ARADLLLEEDARQEQGDQRPNEGQRDRLRERHQADSPEEEERHYRPQDAARHVDLQRGSIGPRQPARQVQSSAQPQIGERSPDAYRDDPDGDDEMLHHRIHDRQQGDRAERHRECLSGLLSDAIHAPRLAVYSAASSVGSAAAASISAAFASTSFTIWSIISASLT